MTWSSNQGNEPKKKPDGVLNNIFATTMPTQQIMFKIVPKLLE